VLQPAAYWLHGEENRTGPRPRSSAGDRPALQEIQYAKGGPWTSRDVRDESGLLVGWGDEGYGFMHLGFQEYLAAREISRRYCLRDEEPLKELAGRSGRAVGRR